MIKAERKRTLNLIRYPKVRQQLTEIAHQFEVAHSVALQVAIAYEYGIYSKRGPVRRFDPSIQREAAIHFWHNYNQNEDEKLSNFLKQEELFYTGFARNAITSFHKKMRNNEIDVTKKEFTYYFTRNKSKSKDERDYKVYKKEAKNRGWKIKTYEEWLSS